MSLKDYLASRRTEIEAEIKALKSELAEIRVAEAAIGVPHPNIPRRLGVKKQKNSIKSGTIKDWVVRTLEDYPDGLETEGVIDAIARRGGPVVIRNSMTPQLSRLKENGIIVQVDRNWLLSSHIPSAPTASDFIKDEELETLLWLPPKNRTGWDDHTARNAAVAPDDWEEDDFSDLI